MIFISFQAKRPGAFRGRARARGRNCSITQGERFLLELALELLLFPLLFLEDKGQEQVSGTVQVQVQDLELPTLIEQLHVVDVTSRFSTLFDRDHAHELLGYPD